ncbi:MAG TPA: hypothetical protein VIK04_15630 [Solirubrobacteraceae bacterium]
MLGILVACVVGFAVMSASASAATVQLIGQLSSGAAINSAAPLAVEARGGRIIKRGSPVTIPVTMPRPGDQCKLLPGLPGTPPS